jgi:hypothetical protein
MGPVGSPIGPCGVKAANQVIAYSIGFAVVFPYMGLARPVRWI